MMSQTLLRKILCSEACENVDKIIEFLLMYSINDYIYPSVFKRNFEVSTEDTYKILNLLEKNNILKLVYILECFTCNNIIAVYDKFNEIRELECENCNEKLTIPNNVRVAYKVIVKWKK